MLRILVSSALLAATAIACGGVSSPLGAAAAQDRVDEVRRLLAAGESPDQLGPGGTTPLIDAVQTNALAAAAALLDAGADPNRRDATAAGWTPLMYAIHHGHAAAVQLLLNRGADPNARGKSGGLPLLAAATQSDPAFVSLLMAHGASARGDGHDGADVLTAAVTGVSFDDTDPPPLVIAHVGFQIASGGCHRETVHALLAHDPGLRLGDLLRRFRGAHTIVRWKCDDLLALVDR